MSQYLSQSSGRKRRYVEPGTEYVDGDQANGGRVADLGHVTLRGKSFDPYKLVRSRIKHHRCSLGLRNDCAAATTTQVTGYPKPFGLYSRFMASEFNPGRGGAVPICFDSNPFTGVLPMHCIDLNTISVGTDDFDSSAIEDCAATFPLKATKQCEDVNARFWIWSHSTTGRDPIWRSIPTQTANSTDVTCRPRWTWERNDFELLADQKIYKRSIDVRMNLYGCAKFQTMFDVRVIRMLDTDMCPDLLDDLPTTNAVGESNNTNPEDRLETFRIRWAELAKPFVSNPLFKGTDPHRTAISGKRWFKTVYKKKVKIAEVAGYGSEGGPPCATLSFSIPINEIQDLAWDSKNSTKTTFNAEFYDGVPGKNQSFATAPGPTGAPEVRYVDNLANVRYNTLGQGPSRYNIQNKPHYKSRLYLLIRALAPRDVRTSDATNLDVTGDNPTPAGGINWNTPTIDGGYFNLTGLPGQINYNTGNQAEPGTTGAWPVGYPNTIAYDFIPSYDLVLHQNFSSFRQDGLKSN